MPKKRLKRHADHDPSILTRDVCLRVKRAKLSQDKALSSSCLQDGASPEAVAHFQALQKSRDSMALADVLEWLGDALLGELIGRCLLSQFHHSPLSARVFRNLRLAVVTNRNLAQVYDAMGYAAVQRRDKAKRSYRMKHKADVVEAVVGELVLKLYEQKHDVERYRVHLDTVIATMLHLHFTDQIKAAQEQGETKTSATGPLSVAFNPFACLEDEQLDEMTGEIIVTKGVFDKNDVEKEEEEVAAAYLREEDEKTESTMEHHSFVKEFVDKTSANDVKWAVVEINDEHVLRTSREIFHVFKTYGMAVLSERLSLLLALSLQSLGRLDSVTPAQLTRQRQLVLSVANLALCADLLGITASRTCTIDRNNDDVQRLEEEHRVANTLRAFVGFHSAIATTSTNGNRRSTQLINVICTTLYDAVFLTSNDFTNAAGRCATIPERESLMTMTRSVNEARRFMSSKTCDDLHVRGERPQPNAAFKRPQQGPLSLLLRHCDSNKLENLLETLHEEHKPQRHHQTSTSSIQRKKKVHTTKSSNALAATAGRMTRNLERFRHRRFLFCLEEIVVLFAQHKTEACRAQIAAFEHDLEPCAAPLLFRKWQVSTSTLTLVMRDGFYRVLLHDICHFHAIISSSRNTRDGTRITQLRLPLHYSWQAIGTRVTTENDARS